MPDNETRAEWADSAVHTHATVTRSQGEGAETKISDLLANLHHLAAREGLDFKELVRVGAYHYSEESGLGFKCPRCRAAPWEHCILRRRGKKPKPRYQTHKAREKLTEDYGW